MILGPRRLVLLLVLVAGTSTASQQDRVVVGSKKFNEGYILGEIMAQLLEDRGLAVDRKFGLGGTLVCFEALRHHEIGVYAEYTGTLEQAILKSDRRLEYDQLASILDEQFDLILLPTFGFDNTYAIALKRTKAEALGLDKISDLTKHPDLRFAFTHEFLNRRDGWLGLSLTYGLRAVPSGIEHGLAYEAIDEGKIDVTDVYSTDGDVDKYDLLLLDDDRGYFPRYLAAPLTHSEVGDRATEILRLLENRIGVDEMRELNGEVLLMGKSFAEVARDFLAREGLLQAGGREERGFWWMLARRTLTHIRLTLVALVAAVLIATPLGVAVYRMKRVSRTVIYVAGMLQTIPSIALLAFMIPLFGIGAVPAIAALLVYALLPILRNTTAALFSIDPTLREVGEGIGLTPWQRVRYIEVPLATPTILAGIKTAAVINIGTATLAAFIGAGGLGEPIVTGLALNDPKLIMEGAIPAAILAIVTELFFEVIERAFIPRHLLQERAS